MTLENSNKIKKDEVEEDKVLKQEKINEKKEKNETKKAETKKVEVKDTETKEYEKTIDNLKKENSKIEDKNSKLQNEMDTLKDRLLRINAEYDNYRKRTAKEKEAIYTDACADVLKYMFPVLDSLESASKANGSIEDIKKGIEMTIKQFKDGFKKLDVEEIKTDSGFDPEFHNAVMHVEDEKYGKNEIVDVCQKGYKRGNKVLRYSMVKVAN